MERARDMGTQTHFVRHRVRRLATRTHALAILMRFYNKQVIPGVGIGATKGLSGCRWKVQVVWMLEEKLAKMQIDAVITDVTTYVVRRVRTPGVRRKTCWLRVIWW